jgi:hypothetical protein
MLNFNALSALKIGLLSVHDLIIRINVTKAVMQLFRFHDLWDVDNNSNLFQTYI